VSQESQFHEALRSLAAHPAARSLADDAAVLELGDTNVVITHDMLVEGVHFLPDDPPGDVAWKLLAVNLSDLAAKGARPVGVLMGYSLRGEPEWDAPSSRGSGEALAAFDVPLLGGDTVSVRPRHRAPSASPRWERPKGRCRAAPARGRGTSSGSAARSATPAPGLRVLLGRSEAGALDRALPQPCLALEAGQRLAPLGRAMMDVSDGLLIDAARMGGASGAAWISISATCRSPTLCPLWVMTGPRACPPLRRATITSSSSPLAGAGPRDPRPLARTRPPFTRIGSFAEGAGLTLLDCARPSPADRLGWEHGPSFSG
jgi:thiamine-monophosphate kinase